MLARQVLDQSHGMNARRACETSRIGSTLAKERGVVPFEAKGPSSNKSLVSCIPCKGQILDPHLLPSCHTAQSINEVRTTRAQPQQSTATATIRAVLPEAITEAK